jgi:hypothetical protein
MLLKQPVDGIEGSVVRLLAMPSLQQIADCIKQHIIRGRGLVHGIPLYSPRYMRSRKMEGKKQGSEGSPLVIFIANFRGRSLDSVLERNQTFFFLSRILTSIE